MSALPQRSVGLLTEATKPEVSLLPAPAPIAPGDIAGLLRNHVAGVGRVLTRLRPGADPVVEHIVVSPAGVDVVQVRMGRGRVGLRHAGPDPHERSLFVGGIDRTGWLADLDTTSADVRDALGRSPLARLRRGWLCITDVDWFEFPAGMRLAGYAVLPEELITRFLPRAGTFGTGHIHVAAERLEQVLGLVPPRVERGSSSVA